MHVLDPFIVFRPINVNVGTLSRTAAAELASARWCIDDAWHSTFLPPGGKIAASGRYGREESEQCGASNTC
jgi:hypothetical protein